MGELKKLRVGIIKLALDFNDFDKAMEFRKKMFKLVTPVDLIIDNSYYGRTYQNWLCYSDKFREVKEGEVYPEYTITVHTNDQHEIINYDVTERDK